MGINGQLRYSVYVVQLDEYVATIPQMRRRNPKRDLSKPYVFVGLTSLRVNRRFNFLRATSKLEWRVRKFGFRLMPELYDSLHPMTCKQALQTANELADDPAI